MYKHLFIDANNLLCRANYVNHLTDRKGRKVSGTFGVMRMTANLLKQFEAKNCVVAWDKGKSKQRISIYPDYKAQRDARRKPEDQADIIRQRNDCIDLFSFLPVKQVMVNNVEADDVIGYLCERLKGKKLIVSNDQDFVQLVRKGVHLYLPNHKKILTYKNVDDFLGFPVKHYVLWKSMVGDSSDNIKGLKGIGPKRATAIIINGMNGGKKPNMSNDEYEICQRNAQLMTIGLILNPKQRKRIRQKYIGEKKKRANFQKVQMKFVASNFSSLNKNFLYWKKPFERLNQC